MKKTILASLAALALLTLTGAAQSPTPSPVPSFDSSVFTMPTPGPTPTPAAPTSAQIAAAKAVFPGAVRFTLSHDKTLLEQMYVQALAQFAPSATLTTTQKLATLSTAQQTAVITIAWQLYNLIETIDPASTVPAPSVSAPVATGT